MPPEAISYLFHHVFLPPKLPQKDDYDSLYDIALVDQVIEALCQFRDHVSSQEADICTTVITMITRLRKTYSLHGGVDQMELKEALIDLNTEGKYGRSNFRS